MCERQRVVLDGVLPPAVCRELIMVARSLAVVGYRDNVSSATIFEVMAAAPEVLVPLVAARQAVHAAVEEALGLPMGLLVEFSGLICWRPGSTIGWHHDANRPYLQQRTYSAVCYLNSIGSDFQGGVFQFEQPGTCSTDGEGGALAAAVSVQPTPGRVVAYSAQEVHSITPVTAGERFTLTLWFTEDSAHCEDTRLLALLKDSVDSRPPSLPASMWLLPDGTDLRLCRLAMAGLGLVWQGRLLLSAADAEDGLAAVAGQAGGGPTAGSSSPLQLQLAVQPEVLRMWLDWRAEPQLSAAVGKAVVAAEAAAGPCSSLQVAVNGSSNGQQAAPGTAVDVGAAATQAAPRALLVPGVEFTSVQAAVLALQHWAWQRGGHTCTRERVCCLHLCAGPAAAAAAAASASEGAPCSCAWLQCCELGGSSNGPGSSITTVVPAAVLQELQEALPASRQYLQQQRAALDALRPSWVQLGALVCEED